LPSDYHSMMQCLNQGSPLTGAAPRSKLWRDVKQLSSQILQEIGDEGAKGDGIAAAKKKFWIF
jgi:Flp pilus assembly CpaE family ATPase